MNVLQQRRKNRFTNGGLTVVIPAKETTMNRKFVYSLLALLIVFVTFSFASSASAEDNESDFSPYLGSTSRTYFSVEGDNYGTTGAAGFYLISNEENTTATITLFGCTGKPVQSKTVTFNEKKDVLINTHSNRFFYGDTMPYRIEWSANGLTAVTEGKLDENPKYKGEADARCVGDPVKAAPLKIKKWSTKAKHVARVGRVISVTPTKTNAEVVYIWTDGSGSYGYSRSLKLQPYHRGETLTMKVIVRKGAKEVVKQIKFSRVK